jgi:NADPH:quinone reductase
MRAAVCAAYGPPENVTVEEVPDPVAADGQVVVDIAAAAVNFPDVLIVADRYQWHADVPFVPGSEFAGTVREVGPGVDLTVGDRVMGASMVGAFAERIAVAARSVEAVAPSVDLRLAAAFGVAHRTAYHALRSMADVQPDEWVVVLGAAGGVGLAAVEVAHLLGAKVLAAASSPEKLAVCETKGADALVNYSTEDLKERIREVTGGGADVVVDPVGGPYTEQALRSTRFGGRFLTLGYASGEIPRVPLNLVLLKGPILTGFTLEGFNRNRPDDEARDRRELLQLLAEGKLVPHVSASYPLDGAPEALRHVAERKATGKVLVEPGG